MDQGKMGQGTFYFIYGLGSFALSLAFIIKIFKYLCNARNGVHDKSENRLKVASAFNILLYLTIWSSIGSLLLVSFLR